MKLIVKTTFDFSKLANDAKGLIKDLTQEVIKSEASKMKERLSSGTTISGQAMTPIKKSTILVRSMRKHSINTPPLNASGRLLKSIKAKKTGISMKKYGLYHNEGFTTQNNPIIPKPPKKAPKGHHPKRFFFQGKKIPSRRFVHNDNSIRFSEETVKRFGSKLQKALRK